MFVSQESSNNKATIEEEWYKSKDTEGVYMRNETGRKKHKEWKKEDISRGGGEVYNMNHPC